ncbi:MAG TPA: hypothetical protein ENK46_05130 [Flavobacteriia bacterium]|nr:hypothetical protein [Flavobacteriia bacterium]
MNANQTRRNFLAISSKILAATVGFITFQRFFSLHKMTDNNNIVLSKLSGNSQGHSKEKFLVAYESKFGSTKEIAETIGKVLSDQGNTVDVKKISDIENIVHYKNVVIGSAIQYDKWMPEAREFIMKNEKILSKKAVDFFLVCLVLSRKDDKTILKAKGYATKTLKLTPTIKVNSFGKFAGVLDYSKMPFAQRILAKGIFAVIGVKEGDYRDWHAIESWAKNISF